MDQPLLGLVALLCAIAAALWARSARHRQRLLRRVEGSTDDADGLLLARAGFRRDLHAAVLYGLLSGAALAASIVDRPNESLVLTVTALPAVATIVFGRGFVAEARAAAARWDIERRAEEVLSQEELAPKRWAARLAPDDLPEYAGFELGRVYQAGTGLMAGDFYDVFQPSPTRLAAVIGDVTGHGIEPSITAFQAKYLLRVFLRQFRDPAQALEELNAQMSALERGDEFISLCVVVIDTEAATLRYASAGHPAAFFWHERDVRPLRATGPLLMLDPDATYFSREMPCDDNDLFLLYTDGLAEARSGDQLFGEERIATHLRRDPGAAPEVLCKGLLEAARDFASGPITDDVAILAVRRT